jgi:nucleoside-diphosphate-sugar epimerase
MRIFIAGHRGYFGSVLSEVLRQSGHTVVGLDTGYFDDPRPGPPGRDVRDIVAADLAGCDGVVNLAAICNDACGEISPAATLEINHVAAARLAAVARDAGVPRYVLASSCSVYGAAGDANLDETSPTAPITAYAASKIEAERSVARLATADFAPVSLRFATLFGTSPSFRSDILLNRILGTALRWGAIRINGDGKLWRPMLHVRDAARAIGCVLAAEPALVRAMTYNVGSTEQNYRLADVVDAALEAAPTARVSHGPAVDQRSYHVRFDRFAATFSRWAPHRLLADGVREVAGMLRASAPAELAGPGNGWGRTDRREHLLALRAAGELDGDFRWAAARGATAPAAAASNGGPVIPARTPPTNRPGYDANVAGAGH